MTVHNTRRPLPAFLPAASVPTGTAPAASLAQAPEAAPPAPQASTAGALDASSFVSASAQALAVAAPASPVPAAPADPSQPAAFIAQESLRLEEAKYAFSPEEQSQVAQFNQQRAAENAPHEAELATLDAEIAQERAAFPGQETGRLKELLHKRGEVAARIKPPVDLARVTAEVDAVMRDGSLNDGEKKQRLEDIRNTYGLPKHGGPVSMDGTFTGRLARLTKDSMHRLDEARKTAERALDAQLRDAERMYGRGSPEVEALKAQKAELSATYKQEHSRLSSMESFLFRSFRKKKKKRGLFARIGRAFKKIGKAFARVAKSVFKAVTSLGKGLLKGAGALFRGDFKGAFRAVATGIKDTVHHAFQALREAVPLMTRLIPGMAVLMAIPKVGGFITKIQQGLVDSAASIAQGVVKTWTSLGEGVLNGASALARGDLKGAFKAVGEGAKQALKSGWKTFNEALPYLVTAACFVPGLNAVAIPLRLAMAARDLAMAIKSKDAMGIVGAVADGVAGGAAGRSLKLARMATLVGDGVSVAHGVQAAARGDALGAVAGLAGGAAGARGRAGLLAGNVSQGASALQAGLAGDSAGVFQAAGGLSAARRGRGQDVDSRLDTSSDARPRTTSRGLPPQASASRGVAPDEAPAPASTSSRMAVDPVPTTATRGLPSRETEFVLGDASTRASQAVKYGPRAGLKDDDEQHLRAQQLGRREQRLNAHYGVDGANSKVLGRLTQYSPAHATYVSAAEASGRPLTAQEVDAKRNRKATGASINHVIASGTGQNVLNHETLRFQDGAGRVRENAQAAQGPGPGAEAARRQVSQGLAEQSAAVGRVQGYSRAILEERRGELGDVQGARDQTLRNTLTAYQGASPDQRLGAYKRVLKDTFDSPGNLRLGDARANGTILTGFDAPLGADGRPTPRAERLLDAHQNYGPERLLTQEALFTRDAQGRAISSSQEQAASGKRPAGPDEGPQAKRQRTAEQPGPSTSTRGLPMDAQAPSPEPVLRLRGGASPEYGVRSPGEYFQLHHYLNDRQKLSGYLEEVLGPAFQGARHAGTPQELQAVRDAIALVNGNQRDLQAALPHLETAAQHVDTLSRRAYLQDEQRIYDLGSPYGRQGLEALMTAEGPANASAANRSQVLNQIENGAGKASGDLTFDGLPVLHASAGKKGAAGGISLFYTQPEDGSGGVRPVAVAQHVNGNTYAVSWADEGSGIGNTLRLG
jgi:hypothetical protein